MKQEEFTCSKCRRVYRWFMKGSTYKLIGDPVRYADKFGTQCVYCAGAYPDGTLCRVK